MRPWQCISSCDEDPSTVTLSGMSSAQPPLSDKKMISVLSSSPVSSSALEDAADALVHAVDLGRVNLHAAQQPMRLRSASVHGGLGRVAIGQLPDDGQDDPGRRSRLLQPMRSRSWSQPASKRPLYLAMSSSCA